MLSTYLILVAAVIIIYLSCELFVNGVEWVGIKFNISQCAVGTILAAIGTALPESVVTFVAVTFNATMEQKDIGVGAALGGPLVLGTLAYAAVGLCIMLFRKKRKLGNTLEIDSRKLSRDQMWFLSIFIFKVLLGVVAFSFKPWLGFLFLGAYALYFYKEMRTENTDICMLPEPLKFQPKKIDDPDMIPVLFQTILALVVIFVSSQLFVKNLEVVSLHWGISPVVVALLLSPVATELPEILNAVIWIRQDKENLALGNISGSMMIQATVPSSFGIFFTPWMFDNHLLWAGIITMLSISYLLLTLRKSHLSPARLLVAALFYVGFAAIFFI